MPSTTVLLHGAGGPHRVSVYAFGDQFDDDLTRAQRRARQELAEVIDRAYALLGRQRALAVHALTGCG